MTVEMEVETMVCIKSFKMIDRKTASYIHDIHIQRARTLEEHR